MDQADIPALLSRLASDEDAARKMAVFKLQSSINDPAFADVFISSGGLVILRRLIMSTGGNTLAYSLQSLTRLLEVDMGWDIFEGPAAGDLVERVVELIVTNPLVNILRGAMSILVALVSHSQSDAGARNPATAGARLPGSFGFRALKPAVAVYPHFFELVIAQLQSADHALCANALMLINALIRDAVSSEAAAREAATVGLATKSSAAAAAAAAAQGAPMEEWSKFIKRLQDLGLIKAVYNLMQSSALQDLAHPLLEFQSLTKLLLRKWREVRVDVERPEHRRGLKGLHIASAPDRPAVNGIASNRDDQADTVAAMTTRKGSRRHNPEKWRRLGFETESPAQEFDVTGFLGMMDLTDYVRKHEDGFQKILLEQSTRPLHERCPIARASLAVTMILYDHFDVDRAEAEEHKGYQGLDVSAKNNDKLFRPLLLQWSRLHTAGLLAFFRLWKATGAAQADFDKVTELVRILVEQVVGRAARTRDVLEVEDDLAEHDCARLRELQMELLELSFEDAWGQHLYQAEEHKSYQGLDVSAKNNDKLFRPLLLQWSRLHTAGLLAFFRLWKATGAAQADFDKVTELVRILVEQVVGRAARTRDVLEVEDDLAEHDCARLRELQMELLELSFEDAWGQHLYQVREELKQEALQFVKEQRVRCLLQGAWFSKPLPRRDTNATDSGDEPPRRRLYTPMPWRFAKLSHNRRFLHYADFVTRTPQEPGLDTLTEKVDLGTISSVVSNVSAPDDAASAATVKNLLVNGHSHTHVNGHGDATPTPTTAAAGLTGSSTKITIFRFADPSDPSAGESAVLALHPVNHSAASEWLDGLLMLLNQAPITAETNKLVGLVSEYGLKIRLLNVRVEAAYAGPPPGAGVVPSRAGLEEDYYYEV
ncbi:Engulfment and cell motility protein 3 like [Verticillium longisporum]|uniref:Engulfment and cell motility protein 3 like n=2 Tax=Verticillium longisporum TaxID=100787 RepID=A0A8I3APH1_VERLO|nr:Engulfment and cell motility protein 3 like [Verticillium longisporum]